MEGIMLKQGFIFDVMWDGVRARCELIEPNTFGTRSGRGCCLLHWLRIGDVFYRRGDREVEFRILVSTVYV